MTLRYERETDLALEIADEEALASRVLEAALDAEDFPFETEVSLIVTDDASIREINREYREIDAATDVLSFPMAEYPAPGDFSQLEEDDDLFSPETGELLLGDIIISAEHVKEQAAAYGHSEEREFAFLVAHSAFHLMGYDHETEEERAVMEEKQEAVLQALGITRD
ncbi:MAG: rRNA maturation RNase YbeY [Lachnospiraceae bacterium]|nr:rRNA maturation RNase YbeY [Lachnospiraceae bacterium]